MDSNLDFLPFLLQKYKNNNEFISLITLFFQEKKQGHDPVHRVVNQQLEQLGKVIGIPIHLSSEFKAYLSNKDNRIAQEAVEERNDDIQMAVEKVSTHWQTG